MTNALEDQVAGKTHFDSSFGASYSRFDFEGLGKQNPEYSLFLICSVPRGFPGTCTEKDFQATSD